MKELSIEQKAKAYDEAKLRMSAAYNSNRCTISFMNEIFPELKESKDERTWLINYLSNRELNSSIIAEKENLKKAIAWLEKQGEQKHFAKYKVGDTIYYSSFGRIVSFVIANIVEDGTDNPMYEDKDGNSVFEKDIIKQKPAAKVEPKFHEGDWCIDNEDGTIFQIVKVLSNTYAYKTNEGKEYFCTHYSLENDARLWTIKDAKAGDVLACEDGWTCIFKALDNHANTFSSYCFMDKYKWFCNTGSEGHTLDERFVKAYNAEIYPATKEQRDLLFSKMKEAGYEWDVYKKELICIMFQKFRPKEIEL